MQPQVCGRPALYHPGDAKSAPVRWQQGLDVQSVPTDRLPTLAWHHVYVQPCTHIWYLLL